MTEDIDLAFIHFVSPGILSEWHILDTLMNCNELMNGIGTKTRRLKEVLFQENIPVSFPPLIRSSGVNVADTAESQTCLKSLVISLTVVKLMSTLIVLFSQIL